MENINIFSIKGTDLAPENSQETVEIWDEIQSYDRYETLEQSMNTNYKSKSNILSEKEEKIRLILRNIPFVVPFPMRLKLFHQFIEQDHKRDYSFIPPVVVRRDYIFEDGYSNLYKLDLKNNINVQFKNKEGLLESGIGQGVFKEFVTELSKTAFGSNYGFFKRTKDQTIYPNSGLKIINDEYSSQFEFLGKIVGKAMYEKILVDIPFAKFFISKVRFFYINFSLLERIIY